MSFDRFGLNDALVQGTRDLGYTDPTPIQEQAIPAVLEGRDVIGLAQTGTGKTAAFLLPILHKLMQGPPQVTRCLILAPTRELVTQTESVCTGLSYRTNVSLSAVYGGADMKPQTRALKAGADIVVATPGRLLDHFYYGLPKVDGLEFLVLDEADRMLDMGFLPDIEKIVRRLPVKRQTLLFSATLPPPIERLAQELLHDPVLIEIGNRRRPAESVSQELFYAGHREKARLLMDLLRRRDMHSVLVFTGTKIGANRLYSDLQRGGVPCAVIHGDREQSERFAALEGFRSGQIPLLVATDIAARGLDVSGISHVVNYDVPRAAEDFIHRIGRTGRAGEMGHAITLCAPDERYKLEAIERALKLRLPEGDVRGGPAPIAAATAGPAAAPPSAPNAARNGPPKPHHSQHPHKNDPRRESERAPARERQPASAGAAAPAPPHGEAAASGDGAPRKKRRRRRGGRGRSGAGGGAARDGARD